MRYFLFFVCISFIFSCHKSKNDFSGNGTLRGRLSYLNIFNGETLPKPLAGKIVKLAYAPSDTLNFLYKTVTDSAGYFSFIRVDEEKEYDIFFQDSINGMPYAAFVTRTPTNDTITLLATNNLSIQNGIYVQVVDNNRQKLGPVGICLFNNQTLALADTCNGSILKINTDINGRGVYYNLAAGPYFLRARKQIGNLVFSGMVNTEVAVTGVKSIELILSPEPVNGFEINITDENNRIINQASACVFNSRPLFQLDSCIGKMETLMPDSLGRFKLHNIPAGKYYFKAYARFGEIQFSGTDSIEVSATGIAKGNLKLFRINTGPMNGFELKVVDIFNNPVHHTNVCVYNSRALYLLDSCIGSIKTLPTDIDGKAHWYDITPGKYYFKAYTTFENISLSGTDSVIVHPAGISTRSIIVK
ncbi:MSCRAMM family protein [Longitalea luteola]|uniref:MSCRAMM family protein n=1 Tax=Longitalea luteola TaxID=2812563 RepID=UPI001A96F90E|nr:hypothetical protein [Longitalea luteola]